MSLKPNIPVKRKTFVLKTCNRCGGQFGPDGFAPTNSLFFPDRALPICNSCVKDFLQSESFSWAAVDKLCQMADIPFIPREWQALYDQNGDDTFPVYARVFMSQEYENIGWDDYYKQFKELESMHLIEDELPRLSDEKIAKLQEKWGGNYSNEELFYLEDLYNGILATQNVNGALQVKQAQQLCMISLELDSRIRAGADFDKLLSSYDKLVKVAEFTPKNAKNASDFDSVGELFHWLEKTGWRNKYYDGATRDVIDEMMKNFENFNQRLYTNESGIAEEIARRVEQLKMVNESEQENFYGINKTYNLDEYDNEGYEQLMEDEEFKEEV